MKVSQEKQGPVQESGGEFMPKKLSPAENLRLTIKVLCTAGVLFAVLWAITRWKTGG